MDMWSSLVERIFSVWRSRRMGRKYFVYILKSMNWSPFLYYIFCFLFHFSKLEYVGFLSMLESFWSIHMFSLLFYSRMTFLHSSFFILLLKLLFSSKYVYITMTQKESRKKKFHLPKDEETKQMSISLTNLFNFYVYETLSSFKRVECWWMMSRRLRGWWLWWWWLSNVLILYYRIMKLKFIFFSVIREKYWQGSRNFVTHSKKILYRIIFRLLYLVWSFT